MKKAVIVTLSVLAGAAALATGLAIFFGNRLDEEQGSEEIPDELFLSSF